MHRPLASLAALLLLLPLTADAHDLSLTRVDTEPREGRVAPSATQLAALQADVDQSPGDRTKRFALVRGLIDARQLPQALAAARAWRAKDAYNLVTDRLVGDILGEMGRKAEARRAYSTVVEMLPHDAEAQRALATVEKQSGDLEAAYERLRVAGDIAGDDPRMTFELADLASRTHRPDEARKGFEAIVANANAQDAVRYPAKQRLAQILSADRRGAIARGDAAEAARLEKRIDDLGIHGGTVNDIKIYLSWDTDRSDVDLWVTTPSGEKVYYQHKVGKDGEALFDDVTTGYGPESFTAKTAKPGTYLVQVNYFGTARSAFPEARGEVTVVLHEGSAGERQVVLPYRLYQVKQTVTVARVQVR
jgi:Flp pilus assembly protein TadD